MGKHKADDIEFDYICTECGESNAPFHKYNDGSLLCDICHKGDVYDDDFLRYFTWDDL